MPEFTMDVVTTRWHEVPGAEGAERFLAERTAGLTVDAVEAAVAVIEYALTVRAETGGLTLLLQEPDALLYAVAVFALVEGRKAPVTEEHAVELVCGAAPGPWEPAVTPVELGPLRGFRVSELIGPESEAESKFQVVELVQTTYVLVVEGHLLTVALSPSSVSVGGLVLAMTESMLTTWNARPHV